MKKTCGNCRTIQPFNATHITCLCAECRSCGALKSVNSAGCKCWTGDCPQEGGDNEKHD